MGKSKNDFMELREAEELNLPVTIKPPSNAVQVKADIQEMEEWLVKASRRTKETDK